MYLLILGGTADGRQLAETLHRQGLPIIYSVAGLVRVPTVKCGIVSGGFSQFGGLLEYVKQQNITAILDATHPYAEKMSAAAVAAAKVHCIPCWRFYREAWKKSPGDRWHLFSEWEGLIAAVQNKKRLFVTVGQVNATQLEELSYQRELVVLRTAVEPKIALASNVEWIKAIGPFTEREELALMQKYNIDALLSKNSGGDSTVAELDAARKLNCSVYMLERPVLEPAEIVFSDKKICEQFVLKHFCHTKM
ncbi:MAG: precorrin-6A/cobalt-precorrin-6A reductase [Pseudomonadales bacterium]|nr:precorrin-6A/cobalt-precorrin-6A reductase [Pseudomonadales bacterium]